MCVPRGVILTVIGCGLSCRNSDQWSYIVEPCDHCFYTGENDRWLVYTSRLIFSLCSDDRRVTGGHRVRRSHARGGP